MSFYSKGNGSFSEGEPVDIKAEMKKGCFMYLGEKKGFNELNVHMLRHVSINEVCLFPHKDEQRSYDWINIFFINLETREVCSMLIKTYNHGQFSKYLRQLAILNNKSDEEIDYTTVETHMEVVEFERKGGETGFKIEFKCCKDKKGNWINGIDEQGALVEDSEIQLLKEDVYKLGEDFYKEHEQSLYNKRIVQEIAEQNFPQYKEFDAFKKKMFKLHLLCENGYISLEKRDELAAIGKGIIPDSVLS